MVVGQTLVIITNSNIKKFRQIDVNGYAYPNIDKNILAKALPHLSYLNIFSHSVNTNGSLNTIDDNALISMAQNYSVVPVMVITNIGPENRFSSDLAHSVLNNEGVQNTLITNVINTMNKKGYRGLTVDFEYVFPEDRVALINFINKVRTEIKKNNYFLMVAVAPKTSDEQVGLLYEAHDYRSIGRLADHVIIMTYEWGYSRGPSRAVAPIDPVQKVLDYAVGVIPSNKILMGTPNYGYDWTLPYVQGTTAKSIGNYQAVDIARNYHQSIYYSYKDEAPFFNYYDASHKKHEVWFEDARSIQSKLELILKYNLGGVSYWTINRFFPQNYLVLDSLFSINKY